MAGRQIRLFRRFSIPLGEERLAIIGPALGCARISRAPFARTIAWVLARCLLVVDDRMVMSGYTWPMLPTNLIRPLIIVSRRLVDGDRRRLAHVLLHEAAHQCFVVWPEWKGFINNLARWLLFFVRWRDRYFAIFPKESIYGDAINSADRVASKILAGCAAMEDQAQ